MASSRTWATPKRIDLQKGIATACVQTRRRVSKRKITGYKRELRSVHAQSPRHSESCAGLGRKPSDGEPANSPEQNYRRAYVRDARPLGLPSSPQAAEANVRLRTHSRLSNEQHDAGRQQQDQDDFAKLCFVERAVEFEPEPGADEHNRQCRNKQWHDLTRDRALAAKPRGAQSESGDPDRLKHGALRILGPAAQLAPYDGDDSGQTGRPAKHAVEKTSAKIAGQRRCLDRC